MSTAATTCRSAQKELQTLLDRQEKTRATLRQTIEALRSKHETEMNLRDGVENGLPELSTLPKRLTIVVSAKDYIRTIKELHIALKDVEQATRETRETVENIGEEAAFQSVLETACSALASCTVLECNIRPIPMELQGTRIETFAEELLSRLQRCRDGLEQSCDAVVQEDLRSCGWPPSFASPSDEPPTPNFWTVLVSENHGAFSKLEASLIKLTILQQAMDGRTLNGQVLWFVKRIVVPLEDRLKLHFASDRETADLSKPDWLFQTASKIIKRHSLGMQYFQGVLSACGLESLFDLEIEFMRCVQLSVQSILAEFHLPKLFSLGSGALWLSWAESAKAFDKEIMEMIGISQEAGDLWEQYLETGTISVFFQEKDWLLSWCNSEVEDALQQLDEIFLRPNAWETKPENGAVAYCEETWPANFAEDAWGLFLGLVQKCQGLPREHVECWLKRVGKAFLMDFGRRLSTHAKTTEAFKELLQLHRAQKAPPPASSNLILSEWSEMEAESKLSADQIRKIFAKEINSFTSFRKEWSLKIAKEIALQFNSDLADYKRSVHLFGEKSHQTEIQGASPAFVPAAVRLKELLEMFSALLDAVSFRQLWKAVTYGIVRIVFNDVITEAKFTSRGAQQLQYDLYVLMDAFSRYTRRPQAHFKELNESCLLLSFPSDVALYLQEAVQSAPDDPTFVQYLHDCGIHVLLPDQISCILAERMDD